MVYAFDYSGAGGWFMLAAIAIIAVAVVGSVVSSIRVGATVSARAGGRP